MAPSFEEPGRGSRPGEISVELFPSPGDLGGPSSSFAILNDDDWTYDLTVNGDGFVRMAVTAADHEVVAGLMQEHGGAGIGSWVGKRDPLDGVAYLAVRGRTAVGAVAVFRTGPGGTEMTQEVAFVGPDTGLPGLLRGHAVAAARRLGASRLVVDSDRVIDVATLPPRATVGVVAAGGTSRRMGEDKTFLEVGGRPMLTWVVEALTGAGVEPVIAGRPSPIDRVASLADPPDVAGPAAALTAAFRSHPGTDAVLVGADQPYLRSETITRLTETPGAAVTVVDGRRQTLCTVYRDECAPVLERLLAERPDPPLQVLLDRVETVEITAETYRGWGEDGRSWLGVDTPEVLRAVREAWPGSPI